MEKIMRGHPNSISARDMEYVLHPVTNARKHEEIGPIVIDRGEGVYVYDHQGNRYIEALAGLWSVAVGFGEKRLVETASRQMARLSYYHTFSHKTNEPSVLLAERLVKMTPDRLKRAFFANSGSEANDSAIKCGTITTHEGCGRRKSSLRAPMPIMELHLPQAF
jgi:4-aminobutyrate---pyruvate transaminase